MSNREGTIQIKLGERLTWEKVIMGDIFLQGSGVFTNIQDVNTVSLDWYTFTNNQPFKLLGNPERDTPPYRQVSRTLGEIESKLYGYVNQWAINKADALTLLPLVDKGLTLYDLVKFLKAHGVKQYDHQITHPVLDAL